MNVLGEKGGITVRKIIGGVLGRGRVLEDGWNEESILLHVERDYNVVLFHETEEAVVVGLRDARVLEDRGEVGVGDDGVLRPKFHLQGDLTQSVEQPLRTEEVEIVHALCVGLVVDDCPGLVEKPHSEGELLFVLLQVVVMESEGAHVIHELPVTKNGSHLSVSLKATHLDLHQRLELLI